MIHIYSPYVSVFSIPRMTFGFAALGQSNRFNSLPEYRLFSETIMKENSINPGIRFEGTLKDAVIRHLCKQQENDYMSALTLGV